MPRLIDNLGNGTGFCVFRIAEYESEIGGIFSQPCCLIGILKAFGKRADIHCKTCIVFASAGNHYLGCGSNGCLCFVKTVVINFKLNLVFEKLDLKII